MVKHSLETQPLFLLKRDGSFIGYITIFIILYGSHTISRNRLVLTDDDDAEHGPLDNLIDNNDYYKKTLHMLCIFHAIIMPFKEKIHPKLPKKTGNKKELSELGEAYGE